MTLHRKSFSGSLQQLQHIVALTQWPGMWEYMPADYWRFICDDGAILNYWPRTGTINFQGPEASKLAFKQGVIDVIDPALPGRLMLPKKSVF